MVNVFSAFRARLLADSRVVALVGDRIYPGVGPQRTAEQAYIVYGVSNAAVNQAMDGQTGYGQTDYAMTVRTTDYAASWALAELIAGNDLLGNWSDPGHGVSSCRAASLADETTELLQEGSETLVYPVSVRFEVWTE